MLREGAAVGACRDVQSGVDACEQGGAAFAVAVGGKGQGEVEGGWREGQDFGQAFAVVEQCAAQVCAVACQEQVCVGESGEVALEVFFSAVFQYGAAQVAEEAFLRCAAGKGRFAAFGQYGFAGIGGEPQFVLSAPPEAECAVACLAVEQGVVLVAVGGLFAGVLRGKACVFARGGQAAGELFAATVGVAAQLFGQRFCRPRQAGRGLNEKLVNRFASCSLKSAASQLDMEACSP